MSPVVVSLNALSEALTNGEGEMVWLISPG